MKRQRVNRYNLTLIVVGALLFGSASAVLAAESAASAEAPKVTFAEGAEPWTRDISHGELLRDGYDEKMVVDLDNLRFLFQGRDPNSGGNYSLLPYRLVLLTSDRSEPQAVPDRRD